MQKTSSFRSFIHDKIFILWTKFGLSFCIAEFNPILNFTAGKMSFQQKVKQLRNRSNILRFLVGWVWVIEANCLLEILFSLWSLWHQTAWKSVDEMIAITPKTWKIGQKWPNDRHSVKKLPGVIVNPCKISRYKN